MFNVRGYLVQQCFGQLLFETGALLCYVCSANKASSNPKVINL